MPDAADLLPDLSIWPANALRLAPLLALLAVAAVVDFRTRRIPNALNLAILAGGLAASVAHGGLGWAGLGGSIAGVAVGFGLMFHAFLFRFSGGGDVKLLAACGAWLGPWGALVLFALQALLGAGLVLGQAVGQGKLTPLLKNTAVLSASLVHAKQLGVEDVTATARQMKSIDRPLPYAVPVLAAAALVPAFV